MSTQDEEDDVDATVVNRALVESLDKEEDDVDPRCGRYSTERAAKVLAIAENPGNGQHGGWDIYWPYWALLFFKQKSSVSWGIG